MKIENFYNNKNIFLTGVTGFLGKVIFEKMLRALPNIGKIYLLIRPLKGSTIQERFNKTVMDSEIFEQLKRQYGKSFTEYVQQKVHLIQGDLLQNGLGLSQSDKELLTNNLNLIINCAASVDFNEKLKNAIQVNVRGTLRMFELAKQCKKLNQFIHVSTAYVNSDKRGWIEEDIYDINQNTEQLMQDLEALPEQELLAQTKTILGQYPNTYVFTKASVERIIKKQKPEGMTISIVRPSIIGSSVEQPTQGWVEGVTAASAIFILSAIGMLTHIHCDPQKIGDMIPVDCVSDQIIVVGALCSDNKKLNVFHSATSSINPLTWGLSFKIGKNYYYNNPPEKRIQIIKLELLTNLKLLRFHQIKRRLEAYSLVKFAQYFGDKHKQKQANSYQKMVYKAEEVSQLFSHFCANEWIFDNSKIINLRSQLTPQELSTYFLDYSNINWEHYILMFSWGLRRFILNEQVEPPQKNILYESSYFSDIEWVLKHSHTFKVRPQSEYSTLILNSQQVQNAIQQIIEQRTQKEGYSTKMVDKINNDTINLIQDMFSSYSQTQIKILVWFLHKIFKKIYEKITINEEQFSFLLKHDPLVNGPLIIVPTNKSFIDSLLVCYIFFAYKIKSPHVLNQQVNSFEKNIFSHIVKAFTAFVFRKKGRKEIPQEIYDAVFSQYILQLLQDDSPLEFFIEKNRTKNGKISQIDNKLIKVAFDAVKSQKIKDATIQPITLNYEKVFETDFLPFDFSEDEQKQQNMISKIIQYLKAFKNNYGRIYVNICQPISIKQNLQTCPQFISQQICVQLTQQLVCMPTSILSALLLNNRKGMKEQQLIQSIQWINQQILLRKGLISIPNDKSGALITLRSGSNLLSNYIVKNKKDPFELKEVKPSTTFTSLITLNYYKNGIFHLFCHEAILSVVLMSFGNQMMLQEGIQVSKVWKDMQFLIDLLQNELTFREKNINNIEDFEKDFLNETIALDIIKIQENKIFVKDQDQINFNCYFIWPLLETYWLVTSYMYPLIKYKNKNIDLQSFYQQLQVFGENMHDERIIQFHESCQTDTIKNAIEKYVQKGYLQIDFNENNQQVIKCNLQNTDIEKIEENIYRFMKKNMVQSHSVAELAKKAIFTEYPLLSKL